MKYKIFLVSSCVLFSFFIVSIIIISLIRDQHTHWPLRIAPAPKVSSEIKSPQKTLPTLSPTRLSGFLNHFGTGTLSIIHFSSPVGSKPLGTSGSILGVFMGDTHLGRGFDYYARKKASYLSGILDSFLTWAENPEASIFHSADFVLGNLETALATKKNCLPSKKSIQIRTDPSMLEYLKKIWFTHFSLANNHSNDCGRINYEKSIPLLQEAWFGVFGDELNNENTVWTGSIRTLPIAFIGLNDTTKKIIANDATKKITQLTQSGYYVVVIAHWGDEYKTKHNERQETLARAFVDAGARIIIGHHPHVIQDFELYKGVPIYYSLGNFLFDQPMKNTLPELVVSLEIMPDWSLNIGEINYTRDPKTFAISHNQ